MPGRVETQACAKQIKLVNVGGDPAPVQFDLWGSLLDQSIGKPTACISHRVSQFFFEGRKRAFRKNETVNNRGADNTERDLLDARNRGVEHRTRFKHARKTDQGGGIAGKHEHVGPGRAVEQRNENA